MPLLVCATPIGNLEDVTLRVLRALAEAHVVLCEDTRRTRVLLDRHGIKARTRSFDRHAEARRTAQVLPLLAAGEVVALVSDAGLPGVSDPGARLVAAALAEGHDVVVLPGPSAVETALVASGLIAERYLFVGYLPRSGHALDALWSELDDWDAPAVAFESARRLPDALASLAAHSPGRRLAICRELTKRFEEVVRGTAGELALAFADAPRGEMTLVIGSPAATGARHGMAAADAAAAVNELVQAGASRRAAARVVGRLTGRPANLLYRSSL